MTVMTVLEPGMLTTVQDLGRFGHLEMAVPESGAADGLSLRLGNRMLGNPEQAAGLEFTLTGPTVCFSADTWVVVTGGETKEGRGVRGCEPVRCRAGEPLVVGALEAGARGYVCVAGGVDVALVLGSRSTLMGAGFGGQDGRALRAGDALPIGAAVTGKLRVDAERARAWLRGVHGRRTIRVVDGLHADGFSEAARQAFFGSWFEVSERSNRTGMRLGGDTVVLPERGGVWSEPTANGCVQVPGDGRPIVLGPDRPTTGGYPVIACVIAADLPVVGMLRPRERIRFERVEVADAARIWAEQEAAFDGLFASDEGGAA